MSYVTQVSEVCCGKTGDFGSEVCVRDVCSVYPAGDGAAQEGWLYHGSSILR